MSASQITSTHSWAKLAVLKVKHVDAEAALVNVPERTHEAVRADWALAGIEVKTSEGALDFHALRHTAITTFRRTGGTRSDARQFSRHASDQMLSNYDHADLEAVRTIQDRMWQVFEGNMVEAMGYRLNFSLKEHMVGGPNIWIVTVRFLNPIWHAPNNLTRTGKGARLHAGHGLAAYCVTTTAKLPKVGIQFSKNAREQPARIGPATLNYPPTCPSASFPST